MSATLINHSRNISLILAQLSSSYADFISSPFVINPQDFDHAAEQVKKLKTSPSNDDLLVLYSYFKQATVGDNNTGK